MVYPHYFQGGLGHIDAASVSPDVAALTSNKIANIVSIYPSVK